MPRKSPNQLSYTNGNWKVLRNGVSFECPNWAHSNYSQWSEVGGKSGTLAGAAMPKTHDINRCDGRTDRPNRAETADHKTTRERNGWAETLISVFSRTSFPSLPRKKQFGHVDALNSFVRLCSWVGPLVSRAFRSFEFQLQQAKCSRSTDERVGRRIWWRRV